MKVELFFFFLRVKLSVILYVLSTDTKKIICRKLITTIPTSVPTESLPSLND